MTLFFFGVLFGVLSRKLMGWRAGKKARNVLNKNLLMESQMLQAAINVASAENTSLETLKELMAQGEAFNVFVKQNIYHDSKRKRYLVFYGGLESRVAAIENLMGRKLWP